MKKSIRRILTLALCLFLCASLISGCATSASQPSVPSQPSAPAQPGPGAQEESWTWDNKIEIMLPSGEGTNTDLILRTFCELLEKEVGVDFILDNMGGASGVTGYTWAYGQDSKEGYFFQFTAPSAVGAAVNGNFDYDFFGTVKPLCGLASCANIVYTNANTEYQTYEDLVKYASANPGKVNLCIQSTTGIDGAVTGQFLSACGLEFNLVSYEEEANAALISGEVDLLMNSYGECAGYVESGDMIPLIVIAESRIDSLPDTPCSTELGLDATLGPWYGFTCMTGTPEAAQKAFTAAVLKCAQDPEWRKFLAAYSYDDFACDTEAFTEVWNETASVMEAAYKYFSTARIT